jgi:hypothetical protein
VIYGAKESPERTPWRDLEDALGLECHDRVHILQPLDGTRDLSSETIDESPGTSIMKISAYITQDPSRGRGAPEGQTLVEGGSKLGLDTGHQATVKRCADLEHAPSSSSESSRLCQTPESSFHGTLSTADDNLMGRIVIGKIYFQTVQYLTDGLRIEWLPA